MIKLVICNQKGGVAKTTTTHSLARYMADMGKRVLMLDTDAQGNLSDALGVKNQHDLHQFIVEGRALEDTVIQVLGSADGSTGSIDMVISSRNTVQTEATLIGRYGREFTLKNMLSTIDLPYDVVLFDTAPTITLLQTCAMVYAQNLLIPVAMDLLSLGGANAALETANMLNGIFNTEIRGVAFLPVMVQKQLQMTKLVRANLRKLSDRTGIPVLPETRLDASVNKSLGARKFLTDFAPEARIVEDYAAAFDVLMKILEPQNEQTTVQSVAQAQTATIA